ncbi:uncharacterized protein M437DRAFT_61880 [Aureobasidium melanogenum CBS 110374]|uniref:Uncharacterized protein n=1 Tax=Aureobasidium melanogenum (strain CBS 110374) TaxID=1043003 RepID=A0A074WC18_AURM1|nr:uncharacterized protein M437DRAFT_61880 [Aureobasidium melanogenum CBS 110374]KEQ67477.1 hypothetical protein M437DRAFT_61880 [Aureobasidium melanogenum CBS 110374]
MAQVAALYNPPGGRGIGPSSIADPLYNSFAQPHVNGTGPSNAVECDGHGTGSYWTCMESLIASGRFAAGLCQTLSGQAVVWGTSTSHGIASHTTTITTTDLATTTFVPPRDLWIETALAISHNDEHLILQWTCISWNQTPGTDVDLT